MAARDNLSEMQALRAQGLSVKQIGARYGISDARVCKLIGKIKVKPRCTRCGETFTATKASALYCPTCRTAMDQRQSNAANRKRMGYMEKISTDEWQPRKLPAPNPECYRRGLDQLAAAIIGQAYKDATGDAEDISENERQEAVDWYRSTASTFMEALGLTLTLPPVNRPYTPEMIA
jgi:predicted  nucleic acid-binding Zn-ribbon protein